ncbi:MAG: SDR family oxidoreductase, partial [Opitutales bacterium]|nr:SDR family oxidoreductase [Opitutales bacterium]
AGPAFAQWQPTTLPTPAPAVSDPCPGKSGNDRWSCCHGNQGPARAVCCGKLSFGDSVQCTAGGGPPAPVDPGAIKAALPGMRRRNWGRIINLVSVHGLVASPFKAAYVAAKHGQIGLTKTIALEVAETGITCNAVCPGYVLTPLVEGQIASQAKAHQLPRERVIREVILAAQPSRRFVTVEEVAALVLFLCGEDARSITGAAIPIDGGWTAR